MPLRAKPAALLGYMVTNPDRLLTKQELLREVWREAVSPGVLKVTVRTVRAALEADVAAPRYLETVGRSGYRFRLEHDGSGSSAAAPFVVGCEATLGRLREHLVAADNGERRIVLLTGEAGIGKSTLLETFRCWTVPEFDVRVARGQCVETSGGDQAYLPLREALEEIAESSPADLGSHNGDGTDSSNRPSATSKEQILTDFARTFEKAGDRSVVVVLLEDLHTSDPSTIEWLTFFARRRLSARVLVVATCRRGEQPRVDRALDAMLAEPQSQGCCEEIVMEPLKQTEVASWLRYRLGVEKLRPDLVEDIHRFTSGNALFLVSMVEYLQDRGLLLAVDGVWQLTCSLADAGVPETLRRMIEARVACAGSDDEELLRAAAVQGYTFDATVVARVLGLEVARVEERLERLAKDKGLVRARMETSARDASTGGRWRFTHVLCQNALVSGLRPRRRRELSGAVAEALENVSAGEFRPREMAGLLEAAERWQDAAAQFLRAAQSATSLFSHDEAAACARRGLQALDALERTPECLELELALELAHGASLSVLHGYSASQTGQSMRRAQRLCTLSAQTPLLHRSMWGLLVYNLVAPAYDRAHEVGARLVAMGEASGDARLVTAGHVGCGFAAIHMGELESGHEHLERGLAVWEPARHREYVALYGLDPGLYLLSNSVRSSWLLGRPAQAHERMGAALEAARAHDDPRSLAFVLHIELVIRYLAGQTELALERAEECLSLCRQHGIAQEQAWTMPYRGRLLAAMGREQEGLEDIRAGLAALRAMQAENTLPHFLGMYAELLAATGDTARVALAIAEALAFAERTHDHCYLAEVHRLHGEILTRNPHRAPGPRSEARAAFESALTIARAQKALAWELRASLSLARLGDSDGHPERAPELLADVVARFSADDDSADLAEARGRLRAC